jgi:hypothetical protein
MPLGIFYRFRMMTEQTHFCDIAPILGFTVKALLQIIKKKREKNYNLYLHI